MNSNTITGGLPPPLPTIPTIPTTPTLPPLPLLHTMPGSAVAASRAATPHGLAGACFLLMLVAGLVSNGVGWLAGQLKLADPAPGWRQLMAAEPMQQLAKAMSDAPLPQAAAALERGLSWLALRDLGPRVREGQRDWLFLADEFTPHTHGQVHASERAQQVVQVQQGLARQGIGLLVVVVPDKSRIAAAHLAKQFRPAGFTDRVTDWTRQLTASGVEVIDLSAALAGLQQTNGAAFLRTDSHWTEQGAQVAAAAVALKLDALGAVAKPAQVVLIAEHQQLPRRGDLLRLAGIDGLPAALLPAAETVQHSRFVVGPGAVTIKPGPGNDDLFGDADLPTLALIGTSFSRTSQFVPFLEHQLQAKVANFARDGGDFSGAARAYFSSPAFKQTPPKWVIWEIPERVLAMGRDHDQLEWAGDKASNP